MKLTGVRADSFLKSPSPDTIGVLLYGPDRGLVKERADGLRRLLSDNPDDPFAITTLSADDLSGDSARLNDEMVAQSLLGDMRVIRLLLDHERGGAAIGKTITALDAKPELCAAKLIIEAGDLSPRSSVRKAFEGASRFATIACYADTVRTLSALVKDSLSASGLRIERDALEAYLPLLEGDRGLARAELEKLIVYKGAGQNGEAVTLDDVKAIASGAGASTIDDIVFDIFSGQTRQADDGLKRAFAAKITAPAVLFAMQRHLNRLHQAVSLLNSGQHSKDAMKALRPPVFYMRQNEFAAQMAAWPLIALDRAIAQSLATEKAMKTAGSPAESLLGRLALALSGYAAKRRR